MNVVEIVRGIGNILFIMIVAGGVAYVGDRVGHQVGRRRLSLLGIRPRYTSTIIAIGTGMVIALVVTLVAIFASQQVKTAFFRLDSLNQQISELQTRESALEAKVNNGRLVVPTGTLMVPFYRIIDQTASTEQRLATIREFYLSAVKFINSTYPRLGLRPYDNPPDIDKLLAGQAAAVAKQAEYTRANVMLTISSYQNLYANDQIHFQLIGTPDVRVFEKGQLIAQLSIPGKSGASANIAISELQRDTSAEARRLNMPDFLAENVQAAQFIPSVAQMQAMISKPGTYLLNAYAVDDVYPHTGGVPIVIVLAQQPTP